MTGVQQPTYFFFNEPISGVWLSQVTNVDYEMGDNYVLKMVAACQFVVIRKSFGIQGLY